MKQFLIGTAIGALLFLCLAAVGVALLTASRGDDAPAGQTAAARCSGLIVASSCNISLHQQLPPERAESKLSGWGIIGLVIVAAAFAFVLGAALTTESWRQALGG